MLSPSLCNWLWTVPGISHIYVVPWQTEKARQTTQDTAVQNKRAQFAPTNSSNYREPSPAQSWPLLFDGPHFALPPSADIPQVRSGLCPQEIKVKLRCCTSHPSSFILWAVSTAENGLTFKEIFPQAMGTDAKYTDFQSRHYEHSEAFLLQYCFLRFHKFE